MTEEDQELKDREQKLRDIVSEVKMRVSTCLEIEIKIHKLFIENRLTIAEKLLVINDLHLLEYTLTAKRMKSK